MCSQLCVLFLHVLGLAQGQTEVKCLNIFIEDMKLICY